MLLYYFKENGVMLIKHQNTKNHYYKGIMSIFSSKVCAFKTIF